MSLILEALRKSEAERRRAQAPDLFAPAQVAVAPVRRLPPAWVLAAAALVLLALAWLVSRAFWSTPPVRELSVETAIDDTPIDRASVGDTSIEGAPVGGASVGSTSVGSTSVDRIPVERPADRAPPTPTQDTSMPTRTAASGTADAATVATTPSAPASPRRLPAPTPADAQAADAAASPAIEPVPARTDVAVAANDRPAAMPTAPVASRATAPAAADDPGLDATAPPMRLSGLAADERRQLPPMKLTMHMWNEARDRRFVILDGRRVAEGDRVGAARVAEIRRDGVILDWNGQRLELPLH